MPVRFLRSRAAVAVLVSALLIVAIRGAGIAAAASPAGTPPPRGVTATRPETDPEAPGSTVTTDDRDPTLADDRPLPFPVALGALGVIAMSIGALVVIKRLTGGSGPSGSE